MVHVLVAWTIGYHVIGPYVDPFILIWLILLSSSQGLAHVHGEDCSNTYALESIVRSFCGRMHG
jgi:hypothetical protein